MTARVSFYDSDTIGDEYAEILTKHIRSLSNADLAQVLVNVSNYGDFVRRHIIREAAIRILGGTDSPAGGN